MTVAAVVILSVAAVLLTWRLLKGPTVADRVIATDALLVTAMCAVLLVAAARERGGGLPSLYVVALLGFIATGVLARYIERRGSS